MKRTFLFSIIMLSIISAFSLSIYTNSFASQSANKASPLPWFSVTIVNGSTPVIGAKVTISGPSGISEHNSDSNGQVCTSHNYGTVRVSWVSGSLSGCTDINHQSQTLCASNPYIVGTGNNCLY